MDNKNKSRKIITFVFPLSIVHCLFLKMPNEKTTSLPFELNNKRTTTGWAFFDWANSAYALVISAAIFPGYYTANTDENINIAGWQVPSSALYSYAVSIAYLIIALLSPTLSGIADFSNRKMLFLKIFTTIGGLSCIALFFFTGMSTIYIGLIAFILSTAGFAGGLVFYNSYLPDIATEDQYDRVSAKGFVFGYIGSVILLVINLFIILNPTKVGLPEGSAGAKLGAQLSFVMVGLWWMGFAQIPFRRLPKDSKDKMPAGVVQRGWAELKNVWALVKSDKNILRFLIAFLFYDAGVQTVLFMASIFASAELKFETSELIILILILQLVAAVGAWAFSRFSEKFGNKLSLLVLLVIWIAICVCSYIIASKIQFYLLGGFVGLTMGGIQSMSRSTYAKLIPSNTKDTASFFSFMDVMDKIAVVAGTFAFGFVNQMTGNIRYSVLALALFFIIGLIIILPVQVKRMNHV